MRVLLDHCVDVRYSKLIIGHEVANARALGWESLSNGRLLVAAEEAGFQVLVTVDKNVRFQQNMANRQISLITLNPRFVDFEHLAPMALPLLSVLQRGFPPGSEIVIDP